MSASPEGNSPAAPSPFNFSLQAAAAVRQHELDRDRLLIGRRIGSGSFAVVHLGRYKDEARRRKRLPSSLH